MELKITLAITIGVCGLLTFAFSVPTKQKRLAPAIPCVEDQCSLPDCRCSKQTIPGDLDEVDVPQMVLLTFDDAITVSNYPFYQDLFADRLNPNQAKVKATFFITHEYTNYSMVHQLWRQGHDIALHSITHVSNTSYWANMNAAGWREELNEQRRQLAHFAKIDINDIKGLRAPFLQMGGDPMYQAITQDFLWECSRPTQNQREPGMWPYTADYLSTQDCPTPPCPTDSYPGFWVFPMIDMLGEDGVQCAMVDECTPVPMTNDDTYNLLMENFLVQYDGNRAPFGVFTHAAWLIGDAGTGDRPEFAERRAGYKRFLDDLAKMPDVFIVGISQVMEWMKNITTIENIDAFEPWLDVDRPDECLFPRNCRYQNSTWERYMSSCVPCPPSYPWLGNPMGA